METGHPAEWPTAVQPPVMGLLLVHCLTMSPVDIATHFGENLRRCRKRADLSQEELSVLASLHRTEISQLERGLRVARIDTLIKLKGSLEVSADDLLEGMDWDPGGTRIGRFRARDMSRDESKAKQAA